MRRVNQKHRVSVCNSESDTPDSMNIDDLHEEEVKTNYEPPEVSADEDINSFAEEDFGSEEPDSLSHTRRSSPEPFPEVPQAALLTQQEEARLGQEIRGTREILTNALAEIPASVVVFVNALKAARSGHRLATDVLFAPIQGGINAANRDKLDNSFETRSVMTDAAHQAKALATLELAYAKWWQTVYGVDSDKAMLQAARQEMVNAFKHVEPGYIVLAEALGVCQRLEHMLRESEKHSFDSNSGYLDIEYNHSAATNDSDSIGRLVSALYTEDKLDARSIDNNPLLIQQLMGVESLSFHQHCQTAVTALKRYCMAREQLVKPNLRLAISIAREHLGRGLALEDLIQEAMMGLIRAADKFDDRLGCRFSTYACTWIRAATVKAFINTNRTIRLSANTRSKLLKINRASQRLRQNLGREPTRTEISIAGGFAEAEIDDLLIAGKQTVSLDTPLREVEGLTLEDLAGTSSQFDPAGWAYSIQLSGEISKLLETLSPRDALVVRLRFGLGGAEPLTLKHIGQLLGLSRERVRQLEVHALAHLRKRINPYLQQVLTD